MTVWSNDISTEATIFLDTDDLLRQSYPTSSTHHNPTLGLSEGLASTYIYQNYPLLGHEVTTNVEDSSNAMGPLPRRRAKKTSTTRPEDWVPHKARIFELYMEKKWKLENVRDTIFQETGFNARYVLCRPREPKQNVGPIL
jgi:hypothetical protein